jgi:hypothetical protein
MKRFSVSFLLCVAVIGLVSIAVGSVGAEPPAQFGAIDVGYSGDWAYVYIDGKKVRTTPLMNYKLKAGKHVVELIDGKKKTVKTWKIDLKPGKNIRLVHSK